MLRVTHAIAGMVAAGGLALAAGSASAVPASGPSFAPQVPAASEAVQVDQVHWRRHGWRGYRRGPSIYFGFGPRWGHGHRRWNRHRW